ncbi:MAG: Calx-beta domain-containing protein [Caldilineaceae bacterium]
MIATETKQIHANLLWKLVMSVVAILFLMSLAFTTVYAAEAARENVTSQPMEYGFATSAASVAAVVTPPAVSIEDQEGEEAFGLIAFVISLNTPASNTVTGKVSTVNVTATAPADYTALANQPFTITAGSTETVIYVDLIDDNFREITETFKLSITQLSNATTSPVKGQGWAYGQIIDNDSMPGIAIADASVNEGAGTAKLLLTLSAPEASDTTVTVQTQEDTANANLDYVDKSEVITFASGQVTATATISILEDLLDEANEQFVVALSDASVLLEDDLAQVTIIDNDSPPNLTVRAVTETEASGVISFSITIDAPSGLDVTGLAATSNGTAKSNSDYVALTNKIFTIPSGLTETTVLVAVNNETMFERTEAFTLSVSNVVNAVIIKSSNIGTILNDDLPPVVSIVNVSNSENGILAFNVTLDAVSGVDVTGVVSTSNDSAIAGQDYTALVNKPFTITAGSMATTVVVTPINDTVDEPDETFLAAVGNLVDGTPGNLVATGTIIDNDPPATLLIQDAFADEAAGVMTFTLLLDTVSSFDIYGILNSIDVSALDSEDYQAVLLRPFTITAGSLSTQVAVTIYDDALDEDDELFRLAAVNVENASEPYVEGLGTILDNDLMPTITLTSTIFAESDSGTITLTLNTPSGRVVSGTLATSDGSATATRDYGPLNNTLFSIQEGEMQTTVEFYIINDTTDEYDETFQASLASLNNAIEGNSLVTITLTDDDAPPTISVMNSSAKEAQGPIQIPVQISQASGKPITGTLSTSNGAAIASSDYTALISKPFTLTAGVTETLVSLAILDDALDENDENINITLNSANNATIATSAAIAVILDDDPAPNVTIANSSAVEASDLMTFTVSLSARSALNVTGVVSTSGDSASSNGDFVALNNQPFTIPAGATSTVISVTINDDGTDEYNELFSLSLSNLVNGQGANTTAIGTIVDDDQPATVSLSSATAVESAQVVTFSVTISPASGKEIQLLLNTVDDSAFAGQDYTQQSNKLITIAAGVTNQTISIPINNDNNDELDETFKLNVSVVDATAALLATTTVTGTITDDDPPPTVTVADVTASETSDALVFTIRLSAASSFTITGTIDTSNGTATAGADYTALNSYPFAFTIGSAQTSISVTLENDYLSESTESFTFTIASISGASLQDGVAIGTISDDDSVGSGTLTIEVDVAPKSIQNFKFVPSFDSEFFLDDEDSALQSDIYTKRKSFTLAAGSYQVLPVTPYSYFLMNIICTVNGTEIKHDSTPQLPVLGSGQVVLCTFVNQRGVTIRLQSYDDRSKNRQYDAADALLAGVTTALYLPPEVTPVLTQTTGSSGALNWSFRQPGTYAVCATNWPTATPLMAQPTLSDSLYHVPCYRFNLDPGTIAAVYFGFRIDDGTVHAAVEGTNQIAALPGTGSMEEGVFFTQVADVADDMQGYDGTNGPEDESGSDGTIRLFLPTIVR